MVSNGDALAKLSKAMVIQPLAQFRLTHQNNLQKFAVVRFEI